MKTNKNKWGVADKKWRIADKKSKHSVLEKNLQAKKVTKSEGNPWKIIEKALLASTLEQSRARRWRIFFIFIFTLPFFVFILFTATSAIFLQGSLKQGKLFDWSQQSTFDGDSDNEHLALIRLNGEISAWGVSSEKTNKELKMAFENENSRALILSINSPGGSPVQAAQIYDEIIRLRQIYPDKKVYAVIADLGASAAYYIAAASDFIYANENSLVGSIGVIYSGFGFTELINKYGIERRLQTAGTNKAFLDPFSPYKEKDRDFWQSVLDSIHQNFIASVKKTRGEKITNEEVYSGRVYSGEQAMKLGLIDGYGDINSIARNMDLDNVVDYSTGLRGLLEKLTNASAIFLQKTLSNFSNQRVLH